MKTNEGQVDRVLRIILGLALLSMTFLLDGPARWFGLLGLLPLATGAVGYCPAYTIFGINTCGSEATKAAPKA